MKRKLALFLVAACCLNLLIACSKDLTAGKVKIVYDDQIHANGSYDENLFYRNDVVNYTADPFVLEITDTNSTEFGYFYLYGTNAVDSGFLAYRSKDLQHWEDAGAIAGFKAFHELPNYFSDDGYWAPEVVYDADANNGEGLYYMFYSAYTKTPYDGESQWRTRMACATAPEPYGPFTPLIDETHTVDSIFFDEELFLDAVNDELNDKYDGIYSQSFPNTIDPHPMVAPDGTKYLYFTLDAGSNNPKSTIWGVKMDTWTKPDYSTLTCLLRATFKTIGDVSPANRFTYERASSSINEGPQMLYRKQSDGTYRYYLTFSMDDAADKFYSVGQAVGYSPLGSFTKVEPEDGGILLDTDNLEWDHVSGPGHHSFITIENQTYIVYHQHKDTVNGGFLRGVSFDRLDWVTNSKGEEVLYANGPTRAIQPRLHSVAEYTNIAAQAKVSVSSGENKNALNDGLLSLYSWCEYIPEYTTKKNSTITLTFDDYVWVNAIMVYNSKHFNQAFMGIEMLEIDFKDNQKDFSGIGYIQNLKFDWDNYKIKDVSGMRPGGSATAVFAPVLVKEIRITVNLPTKNQRTGDFAIMDDEGYFIDQNAVSISEIVILGKVNRGEGK